MQRYKLTIDNQEYYFYSAPEQTTLYSFYLDKPERDITTLRGYYIDEPQKPLKIEISSQDYSLFNKTLVEGRI